jgi:hypothetical protein
VATKPPDVFVPLAEVGSSVPAGLSGAVVTAAGIVVVLAWLVVLFR